MRGLSDDNREGQACALISVRQVDLGGCDITYTNSIQDHLANSLLRTIHPSCKYIHRTLLSSDNLKELNFLQLELVVLHKLTDSSQSLNITISLQIIPLQPSPSTDRYSNNQITELTHSSRILTQVSPSSEVFLHASCLFL